MSRRPPLPLDRVFQRKTELSHTLDSGWAPVTQCLFSYNSFLAIKKCHYFAPCILLRRPRHLHMLNYCMVRALSHFLVEEAEVNDIMKADILCS